MGNIQLNKYCIGAENFSWWTVTAVEAARERCLEVKRRKVDDAFQRARAAGGPDAFPDLTSITGASGCSCYLVRREFRDVFTDFTQYQGSSGQKKQFLALSNEAFDTFAYHEPDSTRVDAVEIVAVLYLMCRGRAESRLDGIFKLFTEAEDPPLQTLRTLFGGLWKIDLIKVQPRSADVEAFVGELRKKSGAARPPLEEEAPEPSTPRFVRGAPGAPHAASPRSPRRSPSTPRLLKVASENGAIQGSRRDVLRSAKEADEANERSAAERRAAHMAEPLPAFTQEMWAKFVRTEPKAKMLAASAETVLMEAVKRRTKMEKAAAAAALTPLAARTQLAVAQTVGKVAGALDKRMMGRTFVNRLVEETNFDIREVRKLKQLFEDRCGLNNELTHEQFFEVMIEAYPSYAGEGMSLAQLFESFDADDSGTIDFKEFTVGMSRLTRGSLQEKLELMFEVYDVDGDGTISVSELVKFIQGAAGELMETTQFSEDILEEMDHDHSGSISKEEFFDSLKRHPVLMESFAGAVLPGVDSLRGPLQQIQAKSKRFTLKTLKGIWDRQKSSNAKAIARGGKEKHGMNLVEFRKFMQEEFNVQPDSLPVCNRCFRLFDKDKSGEVDYKELFNGLAQLMTADPYDKAEFYFHLADRDGGGDLDKNELLTVVLANKEAAEDSTKLVNDMLDKLDADGDGTVSLDEFKTVAKSDPTVLKAFSRLFGGSAFDDADEDEEEEEDTIETSDPEITRMIMYLRAGTGPRQRRIMEQTFARGHRESKLLASDRKVRARLIAEKGLRRLRKQSLTSSAEVVQLLQLAMKDVDITESASGRNPASLAAREHLKSVTARLKRDMSLLKRDSMREAQTRGKFKGAMMAAMLQPGGGGIGKRTAPARGTPGGPHLPAGLSRQRSAGRTKLQGLRERAAAHSFAKRAGGSPSVLSSGMRRTESVKSARAGRLVSFRDLPRPGTDGSGEEGRRKPPLSRDERTEARAVMLSQMKMRPHSPQRVGSSELLTSALGSASGIARGGAGGVAKSTAHAAGGTRDAGPTDAGAFVFGAEPLMGDIGPSDDIGEVGTEEGDDWNRLNPGARRAFRRLHDATQFMAGGSRSGVVRRETFRRGVSPSNAGFGGLAAAPHVLERTKSQPANVVHTGSPKSRVASSPVTTAGSPKRKRRAKGSSLKRSSTASSMAPSTKQEASGVPFAPPARLKRREKSSDDEDKDDAWMGGASASTQLLAFGEESVAEQRRRLRRGTRATSATSRGRPGVRTAKAMQRHRGEYVQEDDDADSEQVTASAQDQHGTLGRAVSRRPASSPPRRSTTRPSVAMALQTGPVGYHSLASPTATRQPGSPTALYKRSSFFQAASAERGLDRALGNMGVPRQQRSRPGSSGLLRPSQQEAFLSFLSENDASIVEGDAF